jgi:hypothetical protein
VLILRSKAIVRLRDGKKLAHDGIKVEFIGSIGQSLFVLSCVTAGADTFANVTYRIVLRPREPL